MVAIGSYSAGTHIVHIDGGYGGMIPSTVVDCTGEKPLVIREGLGVLDYSEE